MWKVTLLLFFLWLEKSLKHVNYRFFNLLETCGLFSDSQYGVRSSRSTEDLLTVASDRIAMAFNRSGATQVVAFDIWVWYAGLLHNLKSYGISGQIFGLILSFLSNRWLQVVLHGRSSQEYLEFLKTLFLVRQFSYYTLMCSIH